MTELGLAIVGTGMVTSVGLSAAASCAAIRAKVRNPSETQFLAACGEKITGHSVTLEQSWHGNIKLAKMGALAIEETLEAIPREDWPGIPLLLCISERERPGRIRGLDETLFHEIQVELGAEFSDQSVVIPQGQTGIGASLIKARAMIEGGLAANVLIAATDSLLNWPTLRHFDQQNRILTPQNSNGFIPGEGAAAVLVSAASDQTALKVRGVGLATEPSTIDSDDPLRGEGLAIAIKAALAEADVGLHDLNLRITDLAGEQYYFKETALALARVLRAHKEDFDIWHPAECIGQTGAMLGVSTLVVADAACRKAYAPGPQIICQAANDAGARVAIILQYGSGR